MEATYILVYRDPVSIAPPDLAVVRNAALVRTQELTRARGG